MSLNFSSENIDVKKYTSKDSKIKKITVNPIIYNTTIEIEDALLSLELKVAKLPDGGFNAMINDSIAQSTMTEPLNVVASDVETAIRNVLSHWEKYYLERMDEIK